MKKKLVYKEKVTIIEFFLVEWKVFCDLMKQCRLYTIAVILLYNVSVAVSFTELKFVEFVTNEISYVLDGYGENKRLMYGSLFFLVLLVFYKLADGVFLILSKKYNDVVNANVKERLIKKLSVISYEYFERKETFETINIAGKVMGKYTSAVYGSMEVIKTISLLTVYSILLSSLGVAITIMLISSIIICVLLCGKVSDKQLDYWRSHVNPKTRRNSYFKEIFSNRINQQNIQMQGSYPYFVNKFDICNRAERCSYLKLSAFTEVTELASNVLFIVLFFFVAVTLGKGVVADSYEIGYFSMMIALLGSMFDNLKSFSLFILNNNEFIRVVSKYYEVLEWEENRNFSESIRESIQGNEQILIRNLWYKYPQAEKQALRGVELKIMQGEKIAVVGENGCGKTTLMSIILGLLTSYKGVYRKKEMVCAAVMQDFIEYEFTIRENIELGCGGKKLSDERIEEILKQVGLYEYIITLGQGINTKLGQLDNGTELSKGQWQRLAVGRLLANEAANLWILDEPAAYLDPLAEIDIYKLIFELADNRTVLFTSHRLGFTRMADRILVMVDGKITEDGTHQALMKQNGLYAQMFDIQRKWYQ